MSWLSASATRAGFHYSFAQKENLADITAKAGSQSIASSIVGSCHYFVVMIFSDFSSHSFIFGDFVKRMKVLGVKRDLSRHLADKHKSETDAHWFQITKHALDNVPPNV